MRACWQVEVRGRRRRKSAGSVAEARHMRVFTTGCSHRGWRAIARARDKCHVMRAAQSAACWQAGCVARCKWYMFRREFAACRSGGACAQRQALLLLRRACPFACVTFLFLSSVGIGLPPPSVNNHREIPTIPPVPSSIMAWKVKVEF